MGAASLELLRREESVGEINEESGGHDAGEPIVFEGESRETL
jgi:hypothetical protein